MSKIRGRSAGRRLSQWASLSALATSGASATAMGAVIYHHGPGLTFPLQLPAGNEIWTWRDRESYSDSIAYSGSFLFGRNSVRTTGRTVALLGVQFGAVPANKGQTFNQVGAGPDGLVARWHEAYEFIDREFLLSPGHPNLATLKARLPYSWAASQNPYLVSHYRHTTYLTSGNGKIIGIDAFADFTLGVFSPPGFSDEYELFRFQVGSHFDYGWLELSLINDPSGGPDFTPIAYAYNTSGKPIPAGEVPEPRELPLALSALSLGALGLREWRKGRSKTVAA